MAAPCIRIRPYRNADYPRLCAIHDAARRNELALAGLSDAFLPLEVAAGREGLFDYALRVAELDGQGVGRALVEHALAEMGRPVSIEVLAGNAPALALYEGCGFRRTETLTGKMPGNEDFSVTVHVLELP